MLNRDDCESLDKLLTLVKSSDEIVSIEFYYDKKAGWNIHSHPFDGSENPNGLVFQKERLGVACLRKISLLVQKKLGG